MKCLAGILITVGLAWTMPLDQNPEETEDMITGKSIAKNKMNFMWPIFCEIIKCTLNQYKNYRLISQHDRDSQSIFNSFFTGISKLWPRFAF